MGLVEREWGGCLLETTLGILEVKSCFFFSYQQMFLSGKKKLMEKHNAVWIFSPLIL